MEKVSVSGHSWRQRLVCAFGALAGAMSGVLVTAFLMAVFRFDRIIGSDVWAAGILLLVFVVLISTVYRQFRNRQRRLPLLLLYLVPLVVVPLVVTLLQVGALPDATDSTAGPPATQSRPTSRPPDALPKTPHDTAPPVAEIPVTQEPLYEESVVEEQMAAWEQADEAAYAADEPPWSELSNQDARQAETPAWETPAAGMGEMVGVPGTDNLSAMPKFPWPPPKASGIEVLPTVLLRERATLGDVATALDLALVQLARHEIRYYAVPNGFAMVTRLEAIDEEGNSIADVDRDQVDFMTYIRNLFWVPPGYYRMVVFIVTDRLFEAIGSPLDREQADELLVGGFVDLPQLLSERQYSDAYRTTALIYEFRKARQREVAKVVSPGRFDAHHHLDRIGWFDAAREALQLADAVVLFAAPTAAGGDRP